MLDLGGLEGPGDFLRYSNKAFVWRWRAQGLLWVAVWVAILVYKDLLSLWRLWHFVWYLLAWRDLYPFWALGAL